MLAAGGAYYWWYGPSLPWDEQSSSDRIGRGERQAQVSALREECLGHAKERNYAPALECYREVLELDPEDATAQYAMKELPKQLNTE